MDTPAKNEAAEQSAAAGEEKLAINKDTLHDLDAADPKGEVRGGAAAESNLCSLYCPSAFCITRR